MITEEIEVTNVWQQISMTGAQRFIHIAEVRDHAVYVTVGDVVGDLQGVKLNLEDSARFDRPISVRTDRSDRVATLTVIKG